ncbi:MAG: hypothetical protein HYV39_01710 [Candidatus Levybacteria bacterium]|nr:hypothetical protein [Candidatus Levybacteria bacterium]
MGEHEDHLRQPGILTFRDVFLDRAGAQPIPRGYTTQIQLAGLLIGFHIPENLWEGIASYEDQLTWDARGIIYLLQPTASPVQRTFGELFLRKGKEVYNKLADQAEKARYERVTSRIRFVINGDWECYDVQAWWMFAPYLFEALRTHTKLQGKAIFDEDDAIARIILWAEDGEYRREERGARRVHLKGVEFFNAFMDNPSNPMDMYRLSTNPIGNTHVFTRQQATHVAQEYLLKDKRFDPERAFT